MAKAKALILPIQVVNKNKALKKNKAFSLIELMIVIVIMGLVYSMVNLNFTLDKKTVEVLGPQNIAAFLRSLKDTPTRKFIIYGDLCDKALFDPEIEELNIDKLSFSKSIQVYKSDAFGTYEQKEFSLIEVNEKEFPVCFEIRKYANESVDPMIIKNSALFYYIDPFFQTTQTFKDLESTISFAEKRSLNPDYLGLRRK